MENTIKKTVIDVEKLDNIFEEIHSFMLDTRYECKYDNERVQIADAVFEIFRDIVYIMYRGDIEYLREASTEEAIELLQNYKQVFDSLDFIIKNIDSLKG